MVGQKKHIIKPSNKLLIGYKEWCILPELVPNRIRAKIDTGARTSALHAEDLQIKVIDGEKYVQFKLLPHQDDDRDARVCLARLVDHRFVMSSSGHREKRYVIETNIIIGNFAFVCEITLTDRTLLNYRMIIGRTALRHYFLIDPGRAHVQKSQLIEGPT